MRRTMVCTQTRHHYQSFVLQNEKQTLLTDRALSKGKLDGKVWWQLLQWSECRERVEVVFSSSLKALVTPLLTQVCKWTQKSLFKNSTLVIQHFFIE